MEIGYIIDQRYLSDIAPCEQKPDLGHRANRVINRESYFAYCDSKLRSPLYLQPRFRCPELYFWVYKNRLRVLGSDLELPMDREWTLSLQEKVVRTLGPEWQRESLSIIYHFLREQPFSEYYNALMSFKWAAHLLSFPLFDWYDRIQLVDGKLFGLLPRSKGKNSEYTWQLLTEDMVGIEIQRYGGKSEIGYRKKTNLTQCLVKWHQNDPSTTTNRLIKTYMCWERLPDRKNKNRQAFGGVQLNRDKLNSAIAEAQEKKEQRKQEQAARDFHTYLTETSSLVLWPPNWT